MLEMKDIIRVTDKLYDEESLKIFEMCMNRALHKADIWDFYDLIKHGVNNVSFGEFAGWYKEHNGKLVIFGAGRVGRYTAEILSDNGYKIEAIADSAGKAGNFHEIPIISFDELKKHRGEYKVIIGSRDYRCQMLDQLLRNNFRMEDIYYPRWDYIRGWIPQYFDFFKPEQNEIFADGGAYNGQTTVDFCKWAGSSYEKAYLFEANADNKNMIQDILKNNGIENYELVTKGLYDDDKTLHFASENGTGSRVIENGGIEINVTSVDNALMGKRVSFIKMDIEGSEIPALDGARNTIIKYRPRMAISTYHRINDFIDIPLKILEIEPEYRFAFRQYCTSAEETVLYAWYDK